MMLRKIFLCLLLTIPTTFLFAQEKITIQDFTEKNTFSQQTVSGINWMNEGSNYTQLQNNKIEQYDIASGSHVNTVFDPLLLGMEERINSYSLSADEHKILIMTDRKSIYRRSFTAIYYVYDRESNDLVQLSKSGRQAYATFSPSGSKVAFTRDNNLWVTDLSSMQESQVTTDGKQGAIINGSSDWVYEEELSLTKAFVWSPDGTRLAYYRFDERHVKEYNMQLWLSDDQLYPKDYKYKYPKAGEENATIEIHIYDLTSKKEVIADLGEETDIYIPRIQWTADNNMLSVIRLNRLQNQLDILHINALNGDSQQILSQSHDTYVDIDQSDDLTYLKDQKHFILGDESTGYKHLYLYDLHGKKIRALTNGEWQVEQFLGVDENSKDGRIYYSSTEESPLERHIYSVKLNGKGKKRLSTTKGINRVNISSDYSHFILYQQGLNEPLKVSLHTTNNNTLIKWLEENKNLSNSRKAYQIQPKTYFTFENEGVTLNAYMIKPADFDGSKTYPVLMYQYSGPGSQTVNYGMGRSTTEYWHQLLVQKGYIIVAVDPRGTGARGVEFQKMTYEQLGKYETEDHIAAAKYLAKLPYVDESRIGIWGWSYGGYISSLVLFKGAPFFKAAISVAPVTNWRYYDTIYTERYLGKPQDNPEGYDDNSPIKHADKLEGRLLLIHGTGDDNVHVQNSYQLQNALISAGKQFDSFFYPDRAHGIRSGQHTQSHLFQMMTEFILNNL